MLSAYEHILSMRPIYSKHESCSELLAFDSGRNASTVISRCKLGCNKLLTPIPVQDGFVSPRTLFAFAMIVSNSPGTVISNVVI